MLLKLIKGSGLLKKFWLGRPGQWWVRRKLQSVVPHLSPTASILDLGAGNCLVAYTLRQQSFPVKPIDIANLSLFEELPATVYDGEHLPFEDKSQDIILLLTVLHHTNNPIKILKEATRVAKKIIIIEDVYSNFIQKYLTYGMDTLVNFGHSAMTYQNRSDKEWKAIFKQLELHLSSVSYRRILLFFCQATYVVETP